jgi:uncharacterized metal-binding protein YceD (DUF177 family)
MTTPTPMPEFSHVVPLSEIGSKPVHHQLLASDGERAALTKRFGLIALDRLAAEVTLSSDDIGIVATGSLTADVMQACVVSGAPVPAHLAENFAIRFSSEPSYEPDAEIELEVEECDSMFHDGRVIDLGEAVAQTLGLAIDPFPRSPDAEAILQEAGVKDEQATGPFAALAALRKGAD